jgi:hypothetical protein
MLAAYRIAAAMLGGAPLGDYTLLSDGRPLSLLKL